MELLEVKNEIIKTIKTLEGAQKKIKERAEIKAKTHADYEKKLAVTIIELKNGKIFEIDGEVISGESMPANLIEKIAKGICWKELLEMDTAEGLYKSIIEGIDSAKSILNGYQSLLRNFDIV